MASTHALCRGIVVRVRNNGVPFRTCTDYATYGEYCHKHAPQESRQVMLRALLRPDWVEVQARASLTLGIDGPAYAIPPERFPSPPAPAPRKKTRKPKARKARKAQPTPPVPVAPPATPVVPPVVAPVEVFTAPPLKARISDLLPSREDAADAMARLHGYKR